MYFLKKANSDLLILILLALRIELDSNIIRYRSWNRVSESRSIHLGSISAFTQTSLLSSHIRYPHPKGLDQNELEEAAILFSRLNYFNSVNRDEGDLITCILNSPDPTSTANAISGPAENIAVGDDHSLQNLPEADGAATNELPDLSEITTELSPEDMDLIEILWKQDIDLGVTRDAYDSRQTVVDAEKFLEVDFNKGKDLYNPKEHLPCEEPILVPDPFEGLNYTIDSETGEYLIDEFSSPYNYDGPSNSYYESEPQTFIKSEHVEEEAVEETESLGSFDLDNFELPEYDENFCDINELFSPSDIPDLITDDLTPDPDYFLQPYEDVENNLEQFKILNETSEVDSTRGEMYPNVEDCWSDTTTNMMPLLSLGNSYQVPLTPIQNAVSPSTITSSEGLVMQASIPSADSDFQPLSSSLGSSSIGYAVAESIATLTNDTDPVPTSSISNNLFGAELPELLYTNHTTVPSHHEFMQELFLDDIQLMSLQPNNSIEKQRDDQMDTTSDSVSSGHIASVSDYHDFIDSCSESSSHYEEEQKHCELLVPNPQMDSYFNTQTQAPVLPKKCRQDQNASYVDTAFPQDNSNDQQYFTMKTYYTDSSENSACGVSCGVLNFNKKFDYAVPKPSSYNCTNFLQHNHTYHIPFSNNDSSHKPVMRDKQSEYSDDEINNKDEKKAKELNLPISISDIINLAIEEYNERLSKYDLTEAQMTLIRDIRRRGKNKVAAQNCRKRKMDQINNLQHDLDFLQNEKMKLKAKQNHLIQEKHIIKEKCIQLYEHIMKHTNARPSSVPTSICVSSNNGTSNSDTLIGNIDSNFIGGARTKRKSKK